MLALRPLSVTVRRTGKGCKGAVQHVGARTFGATEFVEIGDLQGTSASDMVSNRMPPRVDNPVKDAVLLDRRALLGSFTVGLLLAARSADAQLTAGVPQIGLLRDGAPTNPVARAMVDAFLAGLGESGYENGRNVHVEARYTEGRLDRFPGMARELAALPLTAIVTANPYATRAVRDATRTIPIVVALDYETDPVAVGWIASIGRPGGNLTGLFLDQPEMSAKLLQFLRECVPGLTRVAVLWDETVARAQFDATVRAARASRLSLVSLRVKRALSWIARASARQQTLSSHSGFTAR